MCAVHIWGLFLESSEKLVVKMHFACFEKLVFRLFFNVKNKKNKTIAKFGGSEIKGIINPEKFRDFLRNRPQLIN